MAWHPTKKILAVGWDNGELLVWNEHDHELHESLPLHKTSITVLGWSSAGTRLSSGDKVKIWNIWDPYHEIHSNIFEKSQVVVKSCFHNFKRESKEWADL